MPDAKANLTKAANINAIVREVDFVSVFQKTWESLMEIMGVSRDIVAAPGTKLTALKASVALQSGNVGEGEEIPYSLATVEKNDVAEVTLEKYCKAVSLEAIQKYGYAQAVGMTDEAFRTELLGGIMDRFYGYAATGSLTSVQTTFQMALAMAKGFVVNKFRSMRLVSRGVVGWCNVIDYYTYAGAANITVQTYEGIQYVKDFMGYNVLFLCSDNEIERGTVIATTIENMVYYHINAADPNYSAAGLSYTTDGVTNLIGFHTEGNYSTAVSECYALLGLELFAEYQDGIAVVKIEASGSIGAISGVSTAAGTAEVGDTVVTLPTTGIDAGAKFYWKAQASTAPAAPTYLSDFDPTGWTAVKNGDVVSSTNGHKYRVVEINGTNQVIATTDGTVVAKAE